MQPFAALPAAAMAQCSSSLRPAKAVRYAAPRRPNRVCESLRTSFEGALPTPRLLPGGAKRWRIVMPLVQCAEHSFRELGLAMTSERGLFGRLLREPLLHFLVIGLAVFGVDRFAGPPKTAPDRQVIDVTAAHEERLAAQFESVWRRPPTRAELDGLVDDHVREEVYYREALALGLDRDDTVIRRRLRQKMEFLGDLSAGGLVPEEAELRSYLEAHADRFETPAKVTFWQVLLEGGASAEVLAALAAGADPAEVGGGTLLPAEMVASARAAVDGTFGAGFFDRVTALPPGAWSGPVSSAFGDHVVLLQELDPATAPPLEAVRHAVEEDWRRAKADDLREAQYQELRARYEVKLPKERAR